MKNLFHFIKRLVQNLVLATLFMLIGYAFLGLCNWSTDIGQWNGFSRVLLGIELVVVSVASYDVLVATVRNFRRTTYKDSETIT